MSYLCINGSVSQHNSYNNHYVSGNVKEYGAIVIDLYGTLIKKTQGSDLVCLVAYTDYLEKGLTYHYRHISYQKDITDFLNFDYSSYSVSRLLFIPVNNVSRRDY